MRRDLNLIVALLLIFQVLSPYISQSLYANEPDPINSNTADVKATDSKVHFKAIANEVIVKYSDHASFLDKQKFKNSNDLEKDRMRRDSLKKADIEKVKLSDRAVSDKIEKVIEDLERDSRVKYVEPNYIMSLQAIDVNDEHFPQQWNLRQINTSLKEVSNYGKKEIIVAILDTGLDFSHPDSPKNTVLGYDFINDDSDPQDDHGHGTFMAGLIAAKTNNGIGVASICSNCSIMPIKVIDQNGLGTYAHLANGIIWAADHGANVINLSLGGYAYSKILAEAVEYAQNKGSVIVAASGNQGLFDPLYPAALPNVIGVGATDSIDELWGKSNQGDSIDIVAPGVDIFGLKLNGGYGNRSGTSVAAAHITGVIGLFFSENPNLSDIELAKKLYESAVDLGKKGKDERFGWGRIDIDIKSEAINLNTDKPIESKEEISNEIILMNQLNLTYTEGVIQKFLETKPGPLKNYIQQSKTPGFEYSAANLLTLSNEGPGYIANPEVILVIIELASGIVTNPKATNAEIRNALNVENEFHWQYLEKMPEFYFPEDENTRLKEYPADTFDSQIATVAFFLDQAANCWSLYKKGDKNTWCSDEMVTFKNGKKVKVSKEINPETFALQYVLARLTDDHEKWRQYISKNEGSFYELYKKWFGDPVKPVQVMTFDDADKVPFLARKPYEGFVNLNSHFDHDTPSYGDDNKMTNLFGAQSGNATLIPNCGTGFNCYEGHDGIDYGTKSNAILAPADGVVFKIKTNMENPSAYGNTIYIKHDTNNNGNYDYITSYSHLEHGNIDSDRDGIPDSIEGDNDTDNDGILDRDDEDSDGDGRMDYEEGYLDGDSDGIFDFRDADYQSSNYTYEHSYTNRDRYAFGMGLSIDPDDPRNTVRAGQFLGWSGGTTSSGSAEFGAHLHFGVRRILHEERDGNDHINKSPEYHLLTDSYGWWANEDDPASSREQISGISKSTSSDWLWGNGTYQYQIDNSDTSFQHYIHTEKKALWQFIENNSAEKNNTLYTFASLNDKGNDSNFRKWDNSTFWVPNLETEGEYVVSVFIPEIDIANKTTTNEARYHIYHKDGMKEIVINQEANRGQWVNLDTLTFKKGAKSGVRLVDEVQNNANCTDGTECFTRDAQNKVISNEGKIIWADAVRWEQARGPKIEVSNLNGKIFKNNDNVDYGYVKEGKNYTYQFEIKNIGEEQIKFRGPTEAEEAISENSVYFSISKNIDSYLDPGKSTRIAVQFKSDDVGTKHSLLKIYSDAINAKIFTLNLNAVSGQFSDVLEIGGGNYWAKRYIKYVADEGVIKGYPDGTFKPLTSVNRIEVLKMAYEGAGIKASQSAPHPDFPDIPQLSPKQWFYDYVADAKQKGYISGKPCKEPENLGKNCFFPTEEVNRYEAAKIIYAVFNNIDYSDVNNTGECTNGAEPFPDVKKDHWACEAIDWLSDEEKTPEQIIRGYDNGYYGGGTFNSKNELITSFTNRGEMAKIIANTMGYVKQANSCWYCF